LLIPVVFPPSEDFHLSSILFALSLQVNFSYFLVIGFVNFRWATDGFKGDGIDMAILSLIATIYLGSAAWYVKTGDTATAAVLTPVGLLQILAALKA
jgi:hypothetical protein